MSGKKMTTEDKVTKNSKAVLSEENCHELKDLSETDRRFGILKRLNAISASVSFHSEFLKWLTEKNLISKQTDDTKDEIQVVKSGTSEDENKRQSEDRSAIEENTGENSNDASNSSDKLGQRLDGSGAGGARDVVRSADNRDDSFPSPVSPDTRSDSRGSTDYTEMDGDENCESRSEEGKMRREEKRSIVQYSYKYNLFSTVYLTMCKFSRANRKIERVLRVMPDNFNALWNKVKMMVAVTDESGDSIDERAEEILNRLELIIQQKGKQMLIAKAEMAAMYADLPATGDSLIRSIRLYEEVLADKTEYSEPMPEKLVAFWKCYLVGTYAKLTNANKALLAKYGFDHVEVLLRTEQLVWDVESSDYISDELKAQMWMDVANTFEHYTQNYQMGRFSENIYEGLSLADCFANAREHEPDNPTILLRSGRELRQRAKCKDDMLEAIRFFEMALNGKDIDDIHDIIYHHMGLTYRSLWITTEFPHVDSTTDDAYSTRNTPHIHPPLGCRVIKAPDHPLDLALIPLPYKEPPKAAFWKVLNPIAFNSENPYLLKARKCFEEANRVHEEIYDMYNSLYFMEIARTHSSTRNVEKSRECLLKAAQLPHSDIVDVDFVGGSLYEHFGVLEENEMMRKEYDEDDAEKVKSLYRESIRLNTLSNTKAVVTFHYILRVLYKQLERRVEQNSSEVDRMILQNEYFLLYMAVQEAENNRDIVNSIATDDFKIALIWRLIEQFNERNQEFDAAAAFTYLSVLAVANKLTTEVNGVTLRPIEKQRMLLESAERVAQQRVAVAETRFLVPQYEQLCDLHDATQEIASSRNVRFEPLTDLELKKLEIVKNIMQPEFKPGYTRCKEQCRMILRKVPNRPNLTKIAI